MAEWEKRAKKTDDVVYFSYLPEKKNLQAREVFLWDIDKTYLDTKFETLRGLLKTATEKAAQKKNIPGSAKLVQTLREAWQKRSGEDLFPIFFITASPPQMERKLREKFYLDGVKPLGIFFKDNLANLRPRRFWRLNKQVGYKLQALLQMRSLLHSEVRLVMFGDDGESDAIIYSLFSDICARRLNTSELRKILNAFYVLDNQVDTIFRLQEQVPNNDPVEKIYINLADDTDSDYYLKFGRRILPTANNFQAALDLCQDDRLKPEHVVIIAANLLNEFGYSSEELALSIDDLIRRGKLGETTCAEIIPFLKVKKILPEDFVPSVKPQAVSQKRGHSVISLEGTFDPWIPEHIDYLHDYR
ncbi:MAG: hypothetical protein A2Z20_09555 [Bdellovibrionales bacterium RBG_16_40_8]|nr:MAG: hypothetical protein A2Z20_09555 [Bdellovibrionales bacterium RBG_16_40_8]